MPDLGHTLDLTLRLLAQLEGLADARRIWIGYSGGLDSTVLLDLAARLRKRLPQALSAVHIDHGLHPDSAAWADHCWARCETLGVPLVRRRVQVQLGARQGREAAARAARYAALSELLSPGDVLLTAHHRDDQAETLLLALMRGAGVRGLAAMPRVAPLGAGRLVRPLLDVARAELRAYALASGLDWLDDPSNLDLSLDRNWLRRRLLPVLAERWPAAAGTLARSAGHCAEASVLVDRLAGWQAEAVAGTRPGTLSVTRLLGLDAALCRAVLRHWIGDLGFVLPDARHLARVMDEVLAARLDAAPMVAWRGCEVRRYRDDLFALAPLPPLPRGVELAWTAAALDLPNGLGRLHLRGAGDAALDPADLGLGPLQVRFGVTGLRCRPLGAAHHRPLKHLYQEAGVAPWLRGYVPLIFAGRTLVAVGDLYLCSEARQLGGDRLRLVWVGRPWDWARHDGRRR